MVKKKLRFQQGMEEERSKSGIIEKNRKKKKLRELDETKRRSKRKGRKSADTGNREETMQDRA